MRKLLARMAFACVLALGASTITGKPASALPVMESTVAVTAGQATGVEKVYWRRYYYHRPYYRHYYRPYYRHYYHPYYRHYYHPYYHRRWW